jgi:hypothetical protein
MLFLLTFKAIVEPHLLPLLLEDVLLRFTPTWNGFSLAVKHPEHLLLQSILKWKAILVLAVKHPDLVLL